MTTTLPACLDYAAVPSLTIRNGTAAATLALALLSAASAAIPLAPSAVAAWWDQATPASRAGLVLRLARALPHLDDLAGASVANPAWRYSIGVPLALASFVVAMRLRRRHRADNTLRAWRSDWRQWRQWCRHNAKPSFNPSAAQLSAFLLSYAPTHKVATIRRLGATLTAMHKAAGFPDPLQQPLHHEVWRDALTPPAAKVRKKRRAKGAASPAPTNSRPATPADRRDEPVDQAEGLRHAMLEQILGAIDPNTRIDARDVALLSCAYDLLGRRAEIVALDVADIAADDKDASGTALIRRSKTDQAGKGKTLFLRPETMDRVRHWLALAEITNGPIFRALPGFAGRGVAAALPPLQPAEVARILRRRVGAVLKDAEGKPLDAVKLFSGHSCRVGAAQDMAEAGATDLDIMLAGRWSSLTMVARYTAKVRAKRGGMAKLSAHQRDGNASEPR